MLNIHYLTDGSGSTVAVQIPIAEWQLFQKDFEAIKQKLEILQGIQDALHEVHQAKKEKRKLQSLNDFLNEY